MFCLVKQSKKIVVCVENVCGKCCLDTQENVPDDCPYAILHCFDTDTFGERRRQSGKTTQLVRLANLLENQSLPVFYLTPTQKQADLIRDRYGALKHITFMGVRNALHKMRGVNIGYVILDEVKPDERQELEQTILIPGRLQLIAHLWTP